MPMINYTCDQNNGKLSSKKIYLIRHGQTDFNLRGIVQGSGINSSLNDFGWSQARAFYAAYHEISFDKVYTSVLVRSQESVKGFIDLGIPYEALVGLNEISWGTKEGQAITLEEDAYYHNMLRNWREGDTSHKIEGGESPEDVVLRIKPAVEHILRQTDEQTILVCMHGRAIRILLCYLLNLPLKNMDMFEHQNLGLYLLDYTAGKFTIEKYNDLTHLSLLS